MAEVRVRFAPSPTGYLHVGGARTALFNWLYARHHGGKFILRIEDTDRSRSTDEAIEQILESMRWLGLDWDEFYRQTDRLEIHRQAAQQLLDKGAAYEHEGAVWFRIPKTGVTVVEDLLLGRVEFKNSELKDLVILRSDGTPTYNFACVVDDSDMRMTHVIRGDDHLNNTPKQILIYRALGREPPKFAHLPMILGPDKTKLSKRHGAVSVLEYRRRGFLPEALINFFARLGWSHGDQEIFSREELVELFDLPGVGKSAAVFDEQKLLWINHEWLKRADPVRLSRLLAEYIVSPPGNRWMHWGKEGSAGQPSSYGSAIRPWWPWPRRRRSCSPVSCPGRRRRRGFWTSRSWPVPWRRSPPPWRPVMISPPRGWSERCGGP